MLFFLINSKHSRSQNLDYLAQAAHSLREILYQFTTSENINGGNRDSSRLEFLKKMIAQNKVDSDEKEIEKLAATLNDLYFVFTQIAHHFRDLSKYGDFIKKMNGLGIGIYDVSKFTYAHFEKLVILLSNVWSTSLPQQISAHNQIDTLVMADPLFVDSNRVSLFFSFNIDIHRYFYNKVDERWLDWLWENGFLNAIKEKSADPTKYSYSLPELGYLVEVSKKVPDKVAEIILKVDMSERNFNPEVVDRFLWICSELPADELSELTKKIRDEEWVRLMSPFKAWGFEYDKMFGTLSQTGKWDSLLELAETVLSVRPREDREKNEFLSDDPFYLNNLEHTKVFENLLKVDQAHAEEAFKKTLKILSAVLVSDAGDKGEVFGVKEYGYYLYDTDFFKLELGVDQRYGYRDNVKDLLAVVKKLAERLIAYNGENARRIYEKYIKDLPDSRSFWRFRLFVWSLCPEFFKEDLKDELFKIFDGADEKFYERFNNVEYSHALKKSFHILYKEEQQEYINKIFEFCDHERDEKMMRVTKESCWEIFSCIFPALNKDQIELAEKKTEKKLEPDFEPHYDEGTVKSGFVNPRAPVGLPELENMSIEEIVNALCGKWSPEEIYKKDTERNFLNPFNAEGMGNLLVRDIAKRPEKYIEQAHLFFQCGRLDEHYTYSFLHGLHELIRKDSYDGSLDCGSLLDFFVLVCGTLKEKKDVFSKEQRRREFGNAWLTNWEGVHKEITDMLKVLLSERFGRLFINFEEYRDKILDLIECLLGNPDPYMKQEIKEDGMDPFTEAINSVRGRAFECLVLFAYLDGKRFIKEDQDKIKEDVKQVYETTLKKENTLAVMFMYGRYLATFYYRNKDWVRRQLNDIFPISQDKHDLFIAALEGYLSTDLYGELFEELSSSLYERAINLTPEQYTKRRYSKEIDESLAGHIALAYIHYESFDTESELFKLFWEVPNIKRHEEFVSFIGRHLISRDDPDSFMLAQRIEKNKVKEKLKVLWDWILKNCHEETVFVHFGFWIGNKKLFFNDSKWLATQLLSTLEKSNGDLEWEIQVMEMMTKLADEQPKETLEIIRLLLLRLCDPGSYTYAGLMYGGNVESALKIIYEKMEDEVEKVINELLVKGSSKFWSLKSILK